MFCRCRTFRPELLLTLVVALVAAHGSPAAGQAAGLITLADDLELHPLAPGVWRHVSWAKLPGVGLASANGLVVIDGGDVALVDTPWDDGQTALILDWAAMEHRTTRSLVVVGHAHQDCLGGLAEAHARGADSYASALTISLARRRGDTIPIHDFVDTLTVRVGGRRLCLRYAGAGHTPDNVVTWLPDARILFGGCLVRAAAARDLGNTAEADLVAWPATIGHLQTLYPAARIVVPGHGASGGPELLRHTADLARRAAPAKVAD